MDAQWSQFTLRVNIRVTIEKAYQAFGTPAGLESWFLRKAVFKYPPGGQRTGNGLLQTGDQYEWFWHGYPDAVVEKGKILEANGINRFSFTFSKGCPVTLSFYTECGETIVELTESNLPTDPETMMLHYVGDSKGWIFYLTNLKSVLENNIDLRNKNMELTDVITA